MPPVTLPDRPNALRAVDEGRANPVEVFVAGWEYTGSDPTIRAAWCSQLLDALESVRGVGRREGMEAMRERAIRVVRAGGLLYEDATPGHAASQMVLAIRYTDIASTPASAMAGGGL